MQWLTVLAPGAAGFQYNSVSDTYRDYDECSYLDGGCDPIMGFVTSTVDESWVIKPCTNTQGSYTCNACPDGFETVGSSCRLPVVPSAGNGTSGEVASVQPKSSLVMNGPAAALVPGSDAQVAFLSAVQADIAASLEVDDPSELVLDNVGRARRLRALRRSMQDGGTVHVELQFDILFDSEDAPDLVVALISQLSDPNSTLCARASSLCARAVPSIVFVCPIGMVRGDGQTLCGKCPWPQYTSDSVTCLECPINMIPSATGDSCQCRDNYFSTTNEDSTERLLTCHSMDYTPAKDSEEEDGLNLQCKACTSTGTDFECVSACQGLDTTVTPGWQSLPIGDGGEQSIFACMGGEKACPGGPAEETSCGRGYSGLLCSSCAVGFHTRSGDCVPCESMTAAGAAMGAVAMLIVILLAWKVKVWCKSTSNVHTPSLG